MKNAYLQHITAMALGALGGWEPLLLLILAAFVLALDLAAIRHIFGQEAYSGRQKALCTAFILLLPVLGALLYILIFRSQTDA
ncbi:MAG: PLDc N-terminal domain-containing protein [Cyclobacteriaceae bacterium]